MLTCVLQGALAGVIAHTVHTDTPVDTGMLHTVVCVHPTGWPFKAGGTGAPVGEGRMKGSRESQWQPVRIFTPYVWRFNYSRPEGNKTSLALKESSGLQSGGEDK